MHIEGSVLLSDCSVNTEVLYIIVTTLVVVQKNCYHNDGHVKQVLRDTIRTICQIVVSDCVCVPMHYEVT